MGKVGHGSRRRLNLEEARELPARDRGDGRAQDEGEGQRRPRPGHRRALLSGARHLMKVLWPAPRELLLEHQEQLSVHALTVLADAAARPFAREEAPQDVASS